MKLSCLILILLCFSLEGISQKYLLDEDVNKDTIIPKVGYRRKFYVCNYTGFGFAAGPNTNTPPSNVQFFNSWQFREGIWGRMNLNKWYALGAYVEYARDAYRLKTPVFNDSSNSKTLWTKQVNNNVVLGIFNRINVKKERIFIDIGCYYAYDFLPRVLTKTKPVNKDFENKKTVYNRPGFMNTSNYGLDFRLTNGKLSLYGRYRVTGLYKKQDYDVPKFMVGLIIDYRN